VVTQGEIVSEKFRELGFPVVRASSHPNRYVRLLEIVGTILRNRNRIDIMIVHTYGGPSFVVEDIASWLGCIFGFRIIMFLHGGAMPEFMSRFPRWTRRVLRRAQVIAAPSAYLARAVEPYGFTARVIPNIIDLNSYPYRRPDQLKPRLFWMRSFHDVWNPLMAVRALARVRQKAPAATLVMAGQNKGLLDQTRKLAEDLGVGAAVRFPGFLQHEGKLAEGSHADIFINTNHIDNMPVAVVEAGALGLPIVTTDVGGIPDLLQDGESALFVRDNDDEQMAEAILSLLDDPDLAIKLSTNGRRVAERSSWDQVRRQWEQIFNELSGGYRDLSQKNIDEHK
jgi:glycosyltransferase involved in cell wall biosynthesis